MLRQGSLGYRGKARSPDEACADEGEGQEGKELAEV